MADSRIDVLIDGKDNLTPQLRNAETSVIRFVGAISAALAGIQLGIAPIKAATDLERELANVQKTTNFTAQQIKTLSSELVRLSQIVNVSAKDLATIAAAAGQQGLGTAGVEGVVKFTDSVSRMSSVLDISVEKAGTSTGKILNIFKLPLSEIERVVSTFNEVSNNSTATGEELIDVVKRIGDGIGTLDLTKVTALAATAIDFGVAPEVAGTAFSKIFAELFIKTEQFSDLLGLSVDNFTKKLKTDGLQTFQDVLAKLRTLNPSDQQEAIGKLFSTGARGGALLNKFIQDGANSVLLKNLESAEKGNIGGVSALKEQATVLNTVNEQVKLLANSFTALGIEATQGFLSPLKNAASELRTAIQGEEFKAFASSLAAALGSIVSLITSLAKGVASLGINFENFILPLKVFLGAKVAIYIAELIAKFTGLSAVLKLVAKDSLETNAAQQRAANNTGAGVAGEQQVAAAAKGSFAARLLGYDQLQLKWRARQTALAEEALAEERVGQARAKADRLAGLAIPAVRAANALDDKVQAAGQGTPTVPGAVAQQRERLRAAEDAAGRASLTASQQLAARIQQAEAESARNRLVIEQGYQERLREIKATGTRVGLTQAKADRAAFLEAEAQSLSRSIVGIETYYTRRASIQNVALQAEIVRERAALQQRLVEFDTLTAQQNARTRAAAAATGLAAGASSGVTAAEKALLSTEGAARRASAAIFSFGEIYKGVVSIVSAAAGLLLRAFFWITLIYSVADALGLIDRLAPLFTKLTDAIGLTSKASRDAAIAAEANRKQFEKDKEALDQLTKAYRENLDAKNGLLTKQSIEAPTAILKTSTDTNKQKQAIEDLSGFAVAAQATQDPKNIGIRRETAEKVIRDSTDQIDRIQKEIQAKQKNLQNALANGFAVSAGKPAKLEIDIKSLQDNLKIAQDNLAAAKAVFAGLSDEANKSATNLKTVGGELAKTFTPGTFKAFEEIVLPIKTAQTEVEKLIEQRKALVDALTKINVNDTSGLADNALKTQAIDFKLESLNKQITAYQQKLREIIVAETTRPGVTQTTLNAWQTLLTLVQLTAAQAQGIDVAVKANPDVPKDGTNAPTAPKPTTGNNTFSGGGAGSAEAKARAERQARFALVKAEAEARINLIQEKAQQELAVEQRLYDRGLLSLKKYYQDRKAVELQSIDNQVKQKNIEFQQADIELGKAKEKAEKLRFEKDKVSIQGQIDVLNLKKNAVAAQTEEDLRKAQEAFSDRVTAETNKLFENSILPSDSATRFQGALTEMSASYRVFIESLRTEGKGALADALLQGFNVEAVKRTLAPIQRELDQVGTGLEQRRRSIALDRQEGKVKTTADASILDEQAVRETIPLMEQQIGLMKDALAQLEKTGQVGTAAYTELSQSIEGAILNLRQLALESDQTARSVNEDLTDSLTDALSNFRPDKSIKDQILSFFLDVVNDIKKIFAKKVSEIFIDAIGSSGTDGLGKFIADALKNGLGALKNLFGNGATALGSTAGAAGFSAAKDTGVAVAADAGATAATSAATTAATATEAAAAGAALSAVAVPAGEAALALGALAVPATETALAMGALAVPAAETALAMGALVTPALEFFAALSALVAPALQAAVALEAVAAAGTAEAVTSVIAHGGGLVGGNLSSRTVNPAIFRGAPRYHTGGIAGLRPNEVPAILEKGERVQTAKQAATADAMVAAAASGGTGQVNIRNVLVTDPNFVPDAISTAQGERAVLTMLQKNRAALKQMVS